MLINVIHAVIQSPALLLFEPLLHARTRVRARYNGYNEEGGRVQETGRALLCPPPSSRIPFRLREFRVPSKKKKARIEEGNLERNNNRYLFYRSSWSYICTYIGLATK